MPLVARPPADNRPVQHQYWLVVIRGNSGSGKTSLARQLRLHQGRGWALVEQDNLRRVILRERDKAGGLAPAFIDHTVRFLLGNGYSVILEGILASHRYGPMLTKLIADHSGPSLSYYLDVSFDETVRRHHTRPQAADFTPEDMRSWYLPRDTIGLPHEQVIAEDSSFEDTLRLMITGLAGAGALRGDQG